MKKVTALFLAMLLCMALSVSALGGSVISGDLSNNVAGGANPTELQYNTVLEQPTIKVTVPNAAQSLVLNPYNIKVKAGVGAASGDSLFGTSVGSGNDNSVLAAKLYLKNESNVPLKVSLKATGDIPTTSKATFATAKVTDAEKTKKVFLFVQVGQDVKSGEVPAAALSALKVDDFATSKKYQAVIKKGDTLLTDVLTMKTPDSMGASANYTTIEVGGNCTSTPTDKWEGTDTVTLKLVFTFQATNNSAANNQ